MCTLIADLYPVRLEDYMDYPEDRVDVDVDSIPDSDTREDDLAELVDFNTTLNDPERIRARDCIIFKEENK